MRSPATWPAPTPTFTGRSEPAGKAISWSRTPNRAAADLLGCDAREVMFGPNMTTLAFWLSRALASEFSPGDEIVVTRLDHDANHAPWKSLEDQGIRLREVPFRREDCTLDLDDLRSKLTARTKLVAIGYASNAVGTINDVAAVTRDAHRAGARVFVDAVHYAPHGPIDVKALDCDFLACSAYKFFGPHQGLLYGKEEHFERLRAYKVRPAEDALPWRFETGTQEPRMHGGNHCRYRVPRGARPPLQRYRQSRPASRRARGNASHQLLRAWARGSPDPRVAADSRAGFLRHPGGRRSSISGRPQRRSGCAACRPRKSRSRLATRVSSCGTATSTPSTSRMTWAWRIRAGSFESAWRTTTRSKRSTSCWMRSPGWPVPSSAV